MMGEDDGGIFVYKVGCSNACVRKWRMVEGKHACEDISVDMKDNSTSEREG